MMILLLKAAADANKRAYLKHSMQVNLTAFWRACAKIKSLRSQFWVLIVSLKFRATWKEAPHEKLKSCSWKGITYCLPPLGSRALVSLFDLTLMLEVEPRELKRKLVQRWRNLEIPEESILGREGGKNLPNGKTILQNSCDADVTIELRESNSP